MIKLPFTRCPNQAIGVTLCSALHQQFFLKLLKCWTVTDCPFIGDRRYCLHSEITIHSTGAGYLQKYLNLWQNCWTEITWHDTLAEHHAGEWWVVTSASKSSIRRFVITEKAPTRAFSWLKAATTAITFKTLLRHYAKQAPKHSQ